MALEDIQNTEYKKMFWGLNRVISADKDYFEEENIDFDN